MSVVIPIALRPPPDGRVSFSEGIEEIADSAFYRFVTITEDSRFTDSVTISLPHTLRRIGRSAFEMVWLRQANLPQVDEQGRRLVWNAYLNGVLEKPDVKTIGIYMRTGFQRAYVASYPTLRLLRPALRPRRPKNAPSVDKFEAARQACQVSLRPPPLTPNPLIFFAMLLTF